MQAPVCHNFWKLPLETRWIPSFLLQSRLQHGGRLPTSDLVRASQQDAKRSGHLKANRPFWSTPDFVAVRKQHRPVGVCEQLPGPERRGCACTWQQETHPLKLDWKIILNRGKKSAHFCLLLVVLYLHFYLIQPPSQVLKAEMQPSYVASSLW